MKGRSALALMSTVVLAFLILPVASTTLLASFAEEFGDKAPLAYRSFLSSADGKSVVTLYVDRPLKKGEDPRYFYLHYCRLGKCGWVNTPADLFVEVELGEYLHNDKLIFRASTYTWVASYLLDLDSGRVSDLGGGSGIFIRKGPYAGLILMKQAKGYASDARGEALGAYWADRLVDPRGNLIRLIGSDTRNCYPLRFLISTDKRYPKLQQSLDEKVCVEQ